MNEYGIIHNQIMTPWLDFENFKEVDRDSTGNVML